ncbi:hypothetical protein AB0L99_26595 [Streptomyces sp. NPDC051954]|uniref:hypothetical protein n=1 Tax=unclassified Streptomyces TaxID=2593676 RepID=UPI0034162F8F
MDDGVRSALGNATVLQHPPLNTPRPFELEESTHPGQENASPEAMTGGGDAARVMSHDHPTLTTHVNLAGAARVIEPETAQCSTTFGIRPVMRPQTVTAPSARVFSFARIRSTAVSAPAPTSRSANA